MADRLILRGRVIPEEGMYTALFDTLNQSTLDHTLEAVLTDVPRLIAEYFDACRLLGTFDAEMARLGFSPTDDSMVRVILDLGAILGPGAKYTYNAALSKRSTLRAVSPP